MEAGAGSKRAWRPSTAFSYVVVRVDETVSVIPINPFRSSRRQHTHDSPSFRVGGTKNSLQAVERSAANGLQLAVVATLILVGSEGCQTVSQNRDRTCELAMSDCFGTKAWTWIELRIHNYDVESPLRLTS